jgi:hypothetical protein
VAIFESKGPKKSRYVMRPLALHSWKLHQDM